MGCLCPKNTHSKENKLKVVYTSEKITITQKDFEKVKKKLTISREQEND